MNKRLFFGGFFSFVLVSGILFTSCDNLFGGSNNGSYDLPPIWQGLSWFIPTTPRVGDSADITLSRGTFDIRWFRDNVLIPGAIASSYQFSTADVGSIISFHITRREDNATHSGSARHPVLPIDAPILTGSLGFSGELQLGQTITVITDNLAGSGELFFEWWRQSGPSSWTTITGATSSTYQIGSSDLGGIIRVWVVRSGYFGTVDLQILVP